MYYYIKTFGCQINKNESERQAAFYEQNGLKETDDWQKATKIFINTCSVRKAADDRVYALLNKIQLYYQNKNDKPEIILSGCMTRYGDKLLNKYPILTKIQPPSTISFDLPTKRKDQTQAFVQISTGCNSFCTYCVVPYARGREKSRSMDDIMKEINQAIAHGYQEITLLGQNVNSWGLEKVSIGTRKENFAHIPSNASQYHDYQGTPPFVKLLQEISKLEQVKKIRFLTSNPWDFHEELIAEIGQNKKIDRFLHLPVQSGSNGVLKRMNRGYTREKYLEIIKKLKQVDSNIQIGTDIIVGFANETEEEFLETVDLVRQANFIVAFVAIYSVRTGTVAAKIYQDEIPFAEKKRRFEILDKMINKDQLANRPKIV